MTSSLSRVSGPLTSAPAADDPVQRPARRLRIVAHNGARIVGGAELALLRLLHGLQSRGHEVVLCCNHEVVEAEARRRAVPAVRLPLRGDLEFRDARRFARFLRQRRPDVVVIGTFKKIWLAGMATAMARVPFTVARIGLASDTPRRLKYRIALRRWVDVVVLNAETMRYTFMQGLPELAAERVVVIYNGVPTLPAQTPTRDIRAEYGIPRAAIVVGAVARLAQQKRLERLVEAITLLPVNVHALIVGDGEERAALEAAIARHGVSDRVHLAGQQDDIAAFHAAMDVFVVCSDQEGMANAMLEAMAAGVPVVSTPVSGAAEALEPAPGGVGPGLIADGFSPDVIAVELRALTDDTQLRAAMSVAAIRASERFTIDRMVDSWERLLQRGAA